MGGKGREGGRERKGRKEEGRKGRRGGMEGKKGNGEGISKATHFTDTVTI